MILELLAFVYIAVSCLIALRLFMAVLAVGGFQEFSDKMNFLVGEELYSSNRVQWLVVITVFFWFLMPLAHLTRRS